jgi:hypothetical protein
VKQTRSPKNDEVVVGIGRLSDDVVIVVSIGPNTVGGGGKAA